MKTIPAALAVLLLAGAATAALAQDRGDDHGQGLGAQAAHPPAAHPPVTGAPAAHPPTDYRSPQGGHARYGAPPPPGQAPVAQQHYDRGAPNGGGQHYDRGPGPAPGAQAGRQWDHERGPQEVIPPIAGRGQSYRPDGHYDGRYDDRGNGRGDGRSGGFAHDGNHGDPRYNPWGGAGQRWQPGHAPPVFWSHDRYHAGGYRAPYGFYVRSWGFGDFLPRGWYAQDYWIGDFLDYDLPYPPPGYEWVRVGGDALMVDRYTGRIVQVVRGIFW